MNNPLEVEWTKRSLGNAQHIRKYLITEFSEQEVLKFENLLEHFENTVSVFPKIYPESAKYPMLRRAVLHKLTSVLYTIEDDRIVQLKMIELLLLPSKTTGRSHLETRRPTTYATSPGL